ncbi:MAG TPA: TolC family protein [Puia sp.]|nr:TolC family protein [Puia sp.]
MRKPPLFLSLFVLLLTVTVRAQDKWDLKRCVDYAVEHNISVLQSDVQARIAKLTLGQSKLMRIPTLSFGSSFDVTAGRSQNPTSFTLNTQTSLYNNVSLQGSVILFNGFNLQRVIDGNRYAWQAMLANTDLLKNNISLNVANAYLQVLLLDQTAQTAQLQMQFSKNQLDITRKQVSAGTLPELNAAELESQVAQDSSSYVTARSNTIQAVFTLKAYMDLDAATPFDVDMPPVDQIPIEQLGDLQPDAVYALALTHQPQQKMDALNIQAFQELVRAASGARYPTVSLFGSLGSNFINTPNNVPVFGTGQIGETQTTHEPVLGQTVTGYYKAPVTPYFTQLNDYFAQSVGLSIQIPIFNQGTLRTNYEKSRLNLRNQELTRDQDNLTLKSNIYQAYTLAVAALEKFEAQKVTLAATQKSYEYAQKRYNVGMSNTIDLLTNQNNYFAAKVNLLYDQFDYVFKMKVLEYYKGMGIKLN